MISDIQLNLGDICAELGLEPQFLLELADKASSLYETFDYPKRRGGYRTISVPNDRLKSIQRVLLAGLFLRVTMPAHVHGCVKGRSIVTNARGHVNKPIVINIDLTDFFGSIRFDTVFEIYRTHLRCDESLANTLARLTTYGGVLPQGAPTSPALANLAALGLDRELIEICDANKGPYAFHYTRYVDDITISGGNDLIFLVDEFYKAIENNGFRANPNKLRIARPNSRQKVTGVIVNQKPNPPKKLVRKIRQEIFYCRKFGLEGHCEKTGYEVEEFLRRLKGLIGYVRMSRPELADEFDIVLHQVRKEARKPGPKDDEQKLMFLRKAIDEEIVVSFWYGRNFFKVAPLQIKVDSDGNMYMKAFQIVPAPRWQNFKLSMISMLDSEEV